MCPCPSTNPLAQTVYLLQGGKVHPNFENKKKFSEKNFLASTTTRKIRWMHWWIPFLNPFTITGDICSFVTTCPVQLFLVYFEISVVPVGHGLSILVMEKSWKINVGKEGAPCKLNFFARCCVFFPVTVISFLQSARYISVPSNVLSFNDLTPLVGQQEGHPACKSSATTIPKVFFYGPWNNSGKISRLDRNGVCLCAIWCI